MNHDRRAYIEALVPKLEGMRREVETLTDHEKAYFAQRWHAREACANATREREPNLLRTFAWITAISILAIPVVASLF